MATFWRLFASCIFSEPRATRFRPASWIRTRATPCVEVWQTYNLRPLRLGEEKKERKKKPQGKNIMVCPIPYGDHNNEHICIAQNKNPQMCCKCSCDSCKMPNWWLLTWSDVNLARSQVYHTERPPSLLAARSPWCNASRGFVTDCWWWSLLGQVSAVVVRTPRTTRRSAS